MFNKNEGSLALLEKHLPQQLAERADTGDVIKFTDENTDNVYVVNGRHYEGGIEDNGISYQNQNNEKYCTYDGCYEIVTHNKSKIERISYLTDIINFLEQKFIEHKGFTGIVFKQTSKYGVSKWKGCKSIAELITILYEVGTSDVQIETNPNLIITLEDEGFQDLFDRFHLTTLNKVTMLKDKPHNWSDNDIEDDINKEIGHCYFEI